MQPIKNKPYIPSGPIPGENFTSDTKNYPWHRPPEHTDMDKAIEATMKQLSTRETTYSLLTVAQAGVPITTIADIFLTNGIGAGKWTPDMALLLAGPVSHIMKIMAEDAGIEYQMGLDDDPLPTINFLKAKSEIDPKKAVNVAENVAAQEDAFRMDVQKQAQKMGGFAGMPKPGEEGMEAPEGPMHEASPMDPQEDAAEGEMS